MSRAGQHPLYLAGYMTYRYLTPTTSYTIHEMPTTSEVVMSMGMYDLYSEESRCHFRRVRSRRTLSNMIGG